MSGRRNLHALLFACGLAGLAIAAWDLTTGGFYFRVFGLRVSSWEAYKPFRLGMAAMVAALWLHDRNTDPSTTTWNLLAAAPWVASAAALGSFAAAIHFRVVAAGDSDGYCYVSQAYLWAAGRLTMRDQLASLAPMLGPAVAPLGYYPTNPPGGLVPVCPPGLPMMMAAAARLAGAQGVYLVVPLLGGLTVWLTYILARRFDETRAGMIAAVLVACSPIFVFQTLLPMSDVPATACWLCVWVLASSPGKWSPLGAGLVASIAIITRPNLLPVAAVPALVSASAARPFTRRLAMFGLGVLPSCVAIAALNQYLRGSALVSSYGPFNYLYAWNRFPQNLHRYLSWLVELNTPGILLALVAPFLRRTKAAFLMLAFSAAVLVCYLFYFVYDSWPFLRFLLPAIPFLFILSSSVVVRLVERTPLEWRGVAVFLLCALLPIWYLTKARDLTVFTVHRAEQRYVVVGEEIGRALEPHAIVLTLIESGSVRLYGNRQTVRWDLVEPAAFDSTIALLQQTGYAPYLLLEEWELPLFRDRFSRASVYGPVDWPPVIEYDGPMKVRIYSFADRAHHARGFPMVTRHIS